MSIQTANKTPTKHPLLPPRLKPTQACFKLWNNERIQFHKPFEKISPLNLAEMIPQEFRNLPLEIEIGCGKGEFMAARSQNREDCFFVGIDRRLDRIQLTQKKISNKPQNKQCLIVHEDARRFLVGGLPQNISALHIYHPDPWPKSKHHKHRFFRSPDALLWALSLKSEGFLYLSTDHQDYFEEILDILASWDDLLLPQIVFKKEFFHSAPKTHFEGIFLNKHEPVFKAVYKKNPRPRITPTELLSRYRSASRAVDR
jgi:tRNA (guanine-N7-)-methyltransferase